MWTAVVATIILHFDLPPQFTYELFHLCFTPFHSSQEIWTQQIDLAPNVWLHSSVGRASHQYRRGHRFESHWSPDFFRLLLSNCLNWKIYCNDHSSLWSTTADHIWIISHMLYASIYHCYLLFMKHNLYMWNANKMLFFFNFMLFV